MSVYLDDSGITDLPSALTGTDKFPVQRASEKLQLQRVAASGVKQYTDGGHTAHGTDVDITLTVATDNQTQRHTGTLTADRTITLSTTDAYAGARFHIYRTGGGAFDLIVDGGAGTLKALATDTWGIFVYTGTVWLLCAYGAL